MIRSNVFLRDPFFLNHLKNLFITIFAIQVLRISTALFLARVPSTVTDSRQLSIFRRLRGAISCDGK